MKIPLTRRKETHAAVGEHLTDTPTIPSLSSNDRNLLWICTDLFARLEDSLVTDRQAFIDDYFVTLAKQDEMNLLWIEPAYYQHLKFILNHEVLPLYDQYYAVRSKFLEKREQRRENKTWVKYCLWTIGLCELVEALVTQGRSLRPQMLFPTVAIEGLLGFGLYYLVNRRDDWILKAEKKKLLNSIREIDIKYEVAKRYETFREYSGGELLNAELQELLASYPSPEEFWRDYAVVRKADPATESELEQLKLPRFKGFLELHAKGTYSPEARQQRFNALFLRAHQAFIQNDREHYALGHLQGKFKPPP